VIGSSEAPLMIDPPTNATNAGTPDSVPHSR